MIDFVEIWIELCSETSFLSWLIFNESAPKTSLISEASFMPAPPSPTTNTGSLTSKVMYSFAISDKKLFT